MAAAANALAKLPPGGVGGGGGGRSVPIDTQFLPRASMTFSQYLMENADTLLVTENPKQVPQP